MQTKLWKLFLASLVLTLAIVASPRDAQACQWVYPGCQEDMFGCCCDKGVICVYYEWQCDQFCGGD